ncbi:MAG TPA: glycoside hydrolase domain-containing protein [Chitinophagaceae bacterium]|nr:glycoside hydrolase domain-containing protein [Chitinophagaceae bacterium]
MKATKRFLLLFFNLFFSIIAFSQHKGEVDSLLLPGSGQHYQAEYDFDFPLDSNAWKKEKPGLHAAFGSEDKLYFRTEVPDLKPENTSWKITGWKGERLNAQVILWSADTSQQIRFSVSDLKNENGKLLRKETIELNKVCYVLANYPYGAKDAVCGSTPYKNGFLMPDRLERLERFDIPSKTIRPIWISCNIPSTAAAGTYHGKINVVSKSGEVSLNISIHVQDQILPNPHDWKFRLDLWQNPWVIAEYYHVKPWGPEHKALLKKHLQIYANAGGKYITTYGVHSPWGDNEYSIEGGMIEWIKKKDGSWKFDYNIFDQYVELAMQVGIDKAITIYTPLPWGERFRYMDETTGNYIYEQWLPTSTIFKSNWDTFLTDLQKHLEKKGWFDKTYLGINENAMEQTMAAIRVIKEHSSKWRITYAGDWHAELDPLLDDYSSVFPKEPGINEVDKRSSRHNSSTFYICCTPPEPNTFLFSPPIEGRWLGWYAMAHHYDGFLRWAYDSWPADPLRDARFGSWAAGDCFLVYPGANSSIRFEKLREGIVDNEKIRMLKERGLKSNDKSVKSLLAELESQLQAINTEKEFNEEKLTRDIENGKRIIDELSEKLIRQK